MSASLSCEAKKESNCDPKYLDLLQETENCYSLEGECKINNTSNDPDYKNASVELTENGYQHPVETGSPPATGSDRVNAGGRLAGKDCTNGREYLSITGNESLYEELEVCEIQHAGDTGRMEASAGGFFGSKFYACRVVVRFLLVLFLVVTMTTVFAISIHFLASKGQDLKEIKSFEYRMLEEFRKVQKSITFLNVTAHQANQEQSLNDVRRHLVDQDRSMSVITRQLEAQDKHLKSLKETRDFVNFPRDCNDILSENNNNLSKVYFVYLAHQQLANVFCDMTTPGGPWLVFQRRMDGTLNFSRIWTSYADGFGDPNGEFWLGNEKLHLLTSTGSYKLRIDLEDWEGQKRYAEYSSISVSNSSDYYRLTVGLYSEGNAGDSVTNWHHGQQFTTKDADHDSKAEFNCAANYGGGWWYNDCHSANLNGFYLRGNYTADFSHGVVWQRWRGFRYSLKTTEMKISRID